MKNTSCLSASEEAGQGERSPQPERRVPPAAASLRAEAKRASEERAALISEANPEARSAGGGAPAH